MTIAPCSWASSASSRASGRWVKPLWRKLEGWTRRTTRVRPSASGASKSADAGPVGRADLDQPRAGPPDDLRDAHAAADLDELAARDRDAPAAPGQADRERDRGRVVVDDERVVGAGQRDEVPLRCPEARAAPAGRMIELEEEVASRGRRGRRDGRRRPGRPAQVRVDDDAGRVDDRGQAGLVRGLQPIGELAGEGLQVARRLAAGQAFPLGGEDLAGRRDVGTVGRTLARLRRGRKARPDDRQQALDARRAEGIGGTGHRSSGSGRERTWRERMGVEPTAPRRARRHRF